MNDESRRRMALARQAAVVESLRQKTGKNSRGANWSTGKLARVRESAQSCVHAPESDGSFVYQGDPRRISPGEYNKPRSLRLLR